jgi:hypothetical protein
MGVRIKKKGHKTMSETKGLVKCVLGFLLAILIIVGGIFGLDVKVDVEDTSTDTTVSEEEVAPPVQDEITETEETPVDTAENQDVVDEVVDTENSPADSTPTEDEQPVVDESGEAEVTQPTDDTEDVVTEGEN